MKRVIFLLATLLLGSICVAHADEDKTDANIVGHVINKHSGAHVPFVTVIIKGTTIGTATNESGHFQLNNLPEGEVVVRVQGIGYKPVEKTLVARANNTKELNFVIEEDMLTLEQVVVSANRNEINRSETAVVINTVTPRIFESTQSLSLSEGLNFTPGLRVENNCQNCGFNQLRMNGLDGPYSQILVNSRPIFSGLAGVYGLEQIPANMIERVEVIRGGGSALFGGNAIAGTVNIITKEPINNTYQINGNYGLLEGGDPDIALSFNTSLVTEDHKSGVFIFAMKRDKEPYDANGDGFSELTNIENGSFGLRAYHRPTHRSKITLELNNLNEYRRGGNAFDKKPHYADIAEMVEHKILGGGLTYEAYSKDEKTKYSLYSTGQQIDRDSYYGAGQDLNAYGVTYNLTNATGIQLASNFDNFLFAPSILTAGTEYNYEELEDEKLSSDDTPNTLIADQVSNNIGVYLQNEWDLDFMTFLAGIRYDHYDIRDHATGNGDAKGSIVNPRANVLFNIFEGSQLRLSYAKGFRAPQIYDEDLHIEVSESRKIIHRNSPDLAPETSHSFTTSLDFTKQIQNWDTYFLVEGFYTRLKDPFVTEYTHSESTGELVYTRMNAQGDAQVNGINLEGKASPGPVFSLQLGFTLQDSKYEQPQAWGEIEENTSTSFMRTPDAYGYFMISSQPLKHFTASVTANYTGPMYVPHLGINTPVADIEEEGLVEAIEAGNVVQYDKLERSDSFLDMGFKLAYDFHLSDGMTIELHAGMQNIFNSYQSNFDYGAYRDPGYVYGPNRPQTFFFGFKIGNGF
jgi:outer membrane receptor for ferrienterochelin and colicins